MLSCILLESRNVRVKMVVTQLSIFTMSNGSSPLLFTTPIRIGLHRGGWGGGGGGRERHNRRVT